MNGFRYEFFQNRIHVLSKLGLDPKILRIQARTNSRVVDPGWFHPDLRIRPSEKKSDPDPALYSQSSTLYIYYI